VLTVRIILADPQTLVRTALKKLFETLDLVEVVAEAEDCKGVLQRLQTVPADLVVAEFTLPDSSGCELVQQVRRRFPGTHVLFLAASHDPAHVRAALRCGASGYLTKSSEPAELDLALRACARGQIYLSPCISRKVVEARGGQRPGGDAVLSRRQREVLRLIGRGKTTKEVAQLMGLSPKTVETHRTRLMQALGLRGITALTHFAVRAGPHGSD
jgi:DNA-binding NarL/FixJ family response regulator